MSPVIAAALLIAAAVWSAVLIVTDLREQRLPDAWTLPACAAAIVACAINPAGWWGLMWPVAYVLAGRGVGGGDVKLALPLGAVLALAGGAGAVLAGMLLASAFTVVILLVRRRRIGAHGPSMLAGAWIVGLAGTFFTPL